MRSVRRVLSPKKPPVITGILPHLKISCDFVSATQSANGSWSNDVLTTAQALRALLAFRELTGEKSLFKQEIGLGIEFLRDTIESLCDEISKAKDLYEALDKKAMDFGNALSALWFAGTLKDVEIAKKAGNPFLRIESTVAKFVKALSNVEVVCSLLNCHTIPYLEPPPEQILDFAFSQFLSKDVLPKDAFLLAITFKNLEKEKDFSSILEEKWKYHTSRRTDEWRNLSLEDGFQKLITDKSIEIIKSDVKDITTLSYGLIAVNRIVEELGLQERIVERLLESKINLLKQTLESSVKEVGKGRVEVPLSELSLFVWALSESPIAKVAFIPFKDSKYVTTAINWFEKMKVEKVKMLEMTQYNLLIGFVLTLIGSIVIMSYLAFSNLGITSSILFGLLGALYFVITRSHSRIK